MKAFLIERKFTADQRKAAAKSGSAMPDGSYPIENKTDLENAVRAIGRAKNPAAVKAHIKKRAAALGASASLPDDWKNESLREKFGSLIYEADGLTQRSSFSSIQDRVMGAIAANIKAGIDMDGDDDGAEDAGRCSECGCVCGQRYGCSCCADCDCTYPKYAYCRDIYPGTVVYSMDGRLFQCDYTDDGEKVTLGTPVEVEQSYTVIGADDTEESLRESAADTAAAKTMVGKFVQDKNAYGASGIYKVHSVDKDGSATLHGPIGKGGVKTVSHKDLVSNHMDLGSSDSLSQVYAAESFRESYRSENARRILMASVAPMQEAAYDAAKGLLILTVIKPGLNKSGERYYPPEVLKRDHKIFEGNKMFMDHQTDREARERPEGSITNWGGTLKKVWAESDGTIKGQAVVIDPALKLKLEELNKQGMLSDMGVSIRALGETVPGEIAGKKTAIVESLLRSRSVDFVTHAGAGGQVEVMESDRDADDSDLDLVSETELRTRRPDLVQLIESAVTQKEKQMLTEKEIQALQEENAALKVKLEEADKPYSEKKFKALEKENETLKAQIAEAEVKEQKATAAQKLAEMLKESKLPEAAQKRLQAQFKDATSDEDFKEAIDGEKEYIKSIGGKSEVRSLGESNNRQGVDDNPAKKMKEAFDRFAPKAAQA